MDPRTFVVVGAGLAGAKAAESLREEGFDGRVVLLGDEAERPYERPGLSKGYLTGADPADKLYVHDAGFYEQHGIELRTGARVDRLDPRARTVALATGETLAYDALLLATGAEPRRLDVPGAELPGVHYLRTRADADTLRAAAASASAAVVVGAGWIGCEVAAALRGQGLAVTMVDPAPLPLVRVLGPEVGAVYRDLHADNGVALRLATGVEAFAGGERVEGVRTGAGDMIAADLVVVGVGVVPRDGLARDAGLAVDDGVLVDRYLRTSAREVWAAGDVANAFHGPLGTRVRVEHWANALNQGPAAARNMLGQETPYERLPYFYSDQYDLGMEYSGYAREWDRVVFRGDPAKRAFVAFWLAGGRVVAGMNANVWDVNDHVQRLIRSRAVVDPARLADPDVPLDAVATG